MGRSAMKYRWLLLLCGAFEAIYAVVNLVMRDADGSWTIRKFAERSTVLLLGKLALAAGVCATGAGIWSLREPRSWLLLMNGAALSAIGLITQFLTKGPLCPFCRSHCYLW